MNAYSNKIDLFNQLGPLAQESAGANACANDECLCVGALHGSGMSPLGWRRDFCSLNHRCNGKNVAQAALRKQWLISKQTNLQLACGGLGCITLKLCFLKP